MVADVGSEVTQFRVGDRVLAQVEHGAYAEQAVVTEKACHRIPPAVGFAEAVAMGLVYQTAHFALKERGQYRTGETVLVTGATGGVGLAAVQLAKAWGAKVLAGVTNPRKAEIARAHGADCSVDLSAENLRDVLREQVRRCTDGRGVDLVLDPVGGDVFDASLRCLAWRGRLVVIGFADGRIPTVRANYLLLKNIAIAGLQWSDYRERDPELVGHVQEEIFELYSLGRLRLRTTLFPMDQFASALAALREPSVAGKVVLTTRFFKK